MLVRAPGLRLPLLMQKPLQTEELVLDDEIQPLCPRHNLAMKYEAKGVKWKAGPDERIESLHSYHCGHMGCSVRYTHTEGHFTVIDVPEVPTLVEEPGANTLTCPRHGTWLYQGNCDESSHDLWRCGVRRCDYEQVGAASA